MENRIKIIKKIIKDGFLHVFGAGTINKIVSLCSSVFIVRVLSQDSYGMYAYVMNIVNMFMIFNGLGTLTGLLQFGCVEQTNVDKKNSYFKYGLRVGFVANLVMCITIIIYAVAMPHKIEGAQYYLIVASLVPLFRYINDSIPTYLRTENENRKYGYIYTLNSVLLLVMMILLSLGFGVFGTILARYVVNTITITVGCVICLNYRKIFIKSNKVKLLYEEKTSFIKYSLITCFNNAISQLLYNIDTFVIGIVIGTTISIASYKVATTIPFGLSFIPTAVVAYIYPKFVKNRDDKHWIKSNYKKMIEILALFNGCIAFFFFSFAKPIITFIFGDSYIDSVVCFRILIIGFWISSTFRIPGGNVLDMLFKVKTNFVISIIAGIANIILDVLCIKFYGAVGAAIATTGVYALTAIMSNICLIMELGKGDQYK